MKEFNTIGLCIPEKHYIADTSDMIEQIERDLVDKGKYFTMNRARQYGKTTTLNLLNRRLSEKYMVLQLSFEAADDYFVSLSQFVKGIVLDITEILEQKKAPSHVIERWKAPVDDNLPLRQLSKKITELCKGLQQEVVLIVDEVDKSSDNQIFLSFLGMLRDKYLKNASGQDITFKSVILAGVYDIKNMKLKLRKEEEHKYNSPWNIAADFTVNMSLSTEQIEKMLEEYATDCSCEMDTEWFAKQIFDYTSGYPFLVSLICKILDEQHMWSQDGLQKAVKQIITSRCTLFDDINKNIDIYPGLGIMIKGILLQGKSFAYTLSDDTVQIGVMFGYFSDRNGQVVISNRIFEMYLYDMYYKAVELDSNLVEESNIEKLQFIKDGCLDMNRILERFAMHYQSIYQENESKFLEEQCRFLFLTFLKPIINGTGNYYIEARTRNQRRMDVIVDYHGRQYIIELKVWRGAGYQEEGLEQLADYLKSMEAEEGWLLSFSFLKKKKQYTGFKEYIVDGKNIKEFVV